MTAIDLLAGLKTGDWLENQTFPALRYAIPGVIPEGSTLVVGAHKIGKSWLVLALALHKATGATTLGSIQLTASPVLYLALEDGDRRMQSRCRMLLGDRPIPAAFEYLTHVEPGQVVQTIELWMRRHAGSSPLAILDTLGKVMPPAAPGESTYQRDYRIGSALKRLTDEAPGSSLIVNHHDRKAASDDFVDSVSGTHGLAGAADTTVVLMRTRGQSEGILKVTGRDVVEGQYAVKFAEGCRWVVDGDDLKHAAEHAMTHAATVGLGERSAKILAVVAAHPEGIGPSDVGRIIGTDAPQAGAYLGRLKDAGRITKVKRGLYAPLTLGVESVESVEADDDGSDELIASPHLHTLHTRSSDDSDRDDGVPDGVDVASAKAHSTSASADEVPRRPAAPTVSVPAAASESRPDNDPLHSPKPSDCDAAVPVPDDTVVPRSLGRVPVPEASPMATGGEERMERDEYACNGNPACTICGRRVLYRSETIERGVCARCWELPTRCPTANELKRR